MTYFNRIAYSDSGSLDSFARLRTSNPYTIFDSKQLSDKAPLHWDEVTSGTGATSTHDISGASTTMAVASNNEYVIRQTKCRWNYQPGKSHLIIMTGVMSTSTNVTKRIGYFNSSTTAPYSTALDGVYFQNDGTNVSVNIAKSGTGLVNSITQANWNVDKMDGNGISKTLVDWSKAQIFFIDFEWLGVGRVRFGLFINGTPYYIHQFLNANVVSSVYMTSPNHSCRYEIRSSGGSGSLVHICSTVHSEGGVEQNGLSFSGGHVNNTSLVTGNNNNTIYALVGLQLRSTYLNSFIIPRVINIMNTTNNEFWWGLYLNPTIAGTFTYNAVTNSSAAIAIGAVANTLTLGANGTLLESGFVNIPNGGGGGALLGCYVSQQIESAVRLGISINGTLDSLVIGVGNVISAATTYGGTIVYRDIV